ncbi:MAG TPA: response regulator [Gemmatimonadales bacterium]|nr:response regulator [Gemmatimonadales bacterium]
MPPLMRLGGSAVLIVDDQPDMLVAMEAMLADVGADVLTARSGREALKHLLDRDFAVILLDVKMPEMDGFETAALIRERERSRGTPIIFLTGVDRSATMAMRGYAVGAVDYLVKPIVPEFVRSKVSVFVDLARKNTQLVQQAERLRVREEEARALAAEQQLLIRELEHKNRELESFSYAVSHDLRAPLRRVDGFARALTERGGTDPTSGRFLENIRESIRQMGQLIDDVLHLSRVTSAEMRSQEVDLSALADLAITRLREAEPSRQVTARVRPGVMVQGDGRLLRIALENLLQNAWKFTGTRAAGLIEFGAGQRDGELAYYVKDNGVGFDMGYAGRLFGPFQRLHRAAEFPGSGIGLATAQRVIHRHGGRIWAEARPDEGATFLFTLGNRHPERSEGAKPQ